MDHEGTRERAAWLDRVPSWAYLAILAGFILLGFALSLALPEQFWKPNGPMLGIEDPRCNDGIDDGSGILYEKYWVYFVCDEGYNPVNTASWAILLGLLILWCFRLSVELGERIDFGFVAATAVYMVAGSVFRVLEDSDLFAPFHPDSGAPAGSGFLYHWLGFFFITPVIYVVVLFIVIGFLLWARAARRVAERESLTAGLRYFAYSLVVVTALYTAFWAADPNFIRFVAPPWVVAGGCAVAYYALHRFAAKTKTFNHRLALATYGLILLILGLYYVVVWNLGGVENWGPAPADARATEYPVPPGSGIRDWPVQWWILAATIIAPGLVAFALYHQAKILGGAGRPSPVLPSRERIEFTPGPPPTEPTAVPPAPGPQRVAMGPLVTVLVLVLLIQSIGAFITVVGMRDLAQRGIANEWGGGIGDYPRTGLYLAAGPALIAAGVYAFKRGVAVYNPALLHYAAPLNLLMVFGQMCDALMTTLGIDLYGYSEKHVLPRTLIDLVQNARLPGIFGEYPTGVVMIPLKLLIVLLVVVAIDVSDDPIVRRRPNLVGMVKLGILMVGLSPGVRDGVRLAMAT